MRDLAAAENVTLTTTGLFTRNMNIAGVGKSPMFMGSVFGLTDEEPWGEPMPIDMIEMEPVRDSLSGVILRNKQSQAFTLWLTDLINKADVKDYRGEMFSNSSM